MPAFVDLTGKKFGRLTALRRVENNRHNQPRWLCRCDCGEEKPVVAGHLTSGSSKSCGCYNRDVHRQVCIERNTSHGESRTRPHRIWIGLAHRTKYNAGPICQRWRLYENFIADMGPPPTDRHTIDRIDNSLGYSPENCRWATMKEQQNNRTNNRRITWNGGTLTLMQWAEKTGIDRSTIARRLDKLGWTVGDALSLPTSPVARSRRST